jgi:hypothetical protein
MAVGIMADDILQRFRETEPDCRGLFSSFDVVLTQNGSIAYRSGLGVVAVGAVLMLAISALLAWIGTHPLNYYVLAGAVLMVVGLFYQVKSIVTPILILEIDPVLRQLTIYSGRRPRDVILLAEIQLFVSYSVRWSKSNGKYCYIVASSGECYPLYYQGSFSCDFIAKALAYVCGKPAVRVTERETGPGAWAWGGPLYQPKRDKHIDTQGMLKVAEVLYDPAKSEMWAV